MAIHPKHVSTNAGILRSNIIALSVLGEGDFGTVNAAITRFTVIGVSVCLERPSPIIDAVLMLEGSSCCGVTMFPEILTFRI